MTAPIMLRPTERERFKRITKSLLRWYKTHERSFLWRSLRRTPYEVLVSEVMLQQTQAAMIDKHLPAFLRTFPTARKLANAPVSEVIRAWQGLGYNRRALNLQRTAQAITARGRRGVPSTMEELLALPGIGVYTASALLTFSFGHEIPVVDVNVERVLSRLWKRMPTTDSKLPTRTIRELDRLILPAGRSAVWHQALMDFGATICTKRSPRCENCPLRSDCRSAKLHSSTTGYAGKNTAKTSSEKRSPEKLHYGAPKRLWRGRILKLVASSAGAHHREIADKLTVSVRATKAEGFEEFVTSILTALVAEGFIREISPSFYSLAE